MKKVLSLAAVALLSLGTLNADIIISAGEKDKPFNKMAEKIMVKINRTDVKIIPSKGSLENLDNLIADKANIGLTFADSYMYKRASDPRANDLRIVGTVGKGCMYAVAKKDGKVKDSGDLKKDGIIVDSGKVGAGANTTWSFMGTLDEGFKKPEVQNIGSDMGLSSVISGMADVTLQMLTPSTTNNLVIDVLNNSDLKFVPFNSWAMNSKLPNGRAIYSKETVIVKEGRISDTTLDTICTDTLIVANKDISDADLNLVAGIIIRNTKEILGEK